MPYPDKLLAEDEEIVRHLHPHWLTVFWPVVWFLLIVGAASFGAALIPVGQQQGLLRLLVVAVAVLLVVALVVVPVLRWLERFIRPRWTTPLEATKRVVGGTVLLLGASLLAPVPLSNVPPALAIVLIAFAYLEEDGILLCVALAVALIMLAAAAAVAWETMSATGWVPGLL